MAYDAINRLIAETWLNGIDIVNAITFEYNAAGNLTLAQDDHSRYAYTYDSGNRILTEDNLGTPAAPHFILTYEYLWSVQPQTVNFSGESLDCMFALSC
jgi:YD repeat-containing protein